MPFKQLQSPPPVKPATREEVFEFLRGLQKFRRKGDEPFNEKAIADYLAQQSLGSLQGIARRIMMDILKSPTADPSPAVPQRRAQRYSREEAKSSSGAKTSAARQKSPRAMRRKH